MRKILLLLLLLLPLTACNAVISSTDASSTASTISSDASSYKQTIELGDEDVQITKAGTYTLTGTLNGSVIVSLSKEDDVNLILEGVTINSGDFAAIYIKEADEAVITLAGNSINILSDSGAYSQIDENEVDALIYSKADLTITGTGRLDLNSTTNHGIISKDDLIIESGTYNIDVAGAGIKGKDLLQIIDGSFNVTSGKDGLKSDNDEDEDRGNVIIENGEFVINSMGDAIYGYRLVEIKNGNFEINTTENTENTSFKAIKSDLSVIISDGTFNIDAADDGIHSDANMQINGGSINIISQDDALHADSKLTINGGTLNLEAHEAIEATYIIINDGDINITATDDAINAAQKVTDYTATFEMNGGNVVINMGQGDTDAIDSNGYTYINGGTLTINAQNAFDTDIEQEFNGGTVIVNGEEVDELPEDMMGGMKGGPGGQGMQMQNGQAPNGTPPTGERPSREKPENGIYFYPKPGEETENNYFIRDEDDSSN